MTEDKKERKVELACLCGFHHEDSTQFVVHVMESGHIDESIYKHLKDDPEEQKKFAEFLHEIQMHPERGQRVDPTELDGEELTEYEEAMRRVDEVEKRRRMH